MSNRGTRPARSQAQIDALRADLVVNVREVNRRLADLRQQTVHFRAALAAADQTPSMKGFFALDVPRWFTAFAAMAVRRELDQASDCVSLRRLLDQIASQPDIARDFRGEQIPPADLRAHKREIVTISQKIDHIADKELAHATIAGPNPNTRPTYAELFHCIDQFESIAARYAAYLTGAPLLVRGDGDIIQVRIAGSSAPQH